MGEAILLIWKQSFINFWIKQKQRPRFITEVFNILWRFLVKPGVAGAAFEHPLEGEAEDPTGAGYMQNAHSYEWMWL